MTIERNNATRFRSIRNWAMLVIAWLLVTSSSSVLGQTAYPEFYVGQATGSGLADGPIGQVSPSDNAVLQPEAMEPHGAIVLDDGLVGGGDWGHEPIGAAACDCCPPEFYVTAEYLAINREGHGGIALSQSQQLGEFHYRQGFRATIGWKNDCLDGYEITFTRPFRWQRDEFVTGTNIQSNFVNAPAFTASLAGFDNAVFHNQSYSSEYYSGEFNRRWWGWDVFSVKAGIRYVNIDEEYEFISVNNGAVRGEFNVETDNHLLGPQLGLDFARPMGRWTLQSRVVGAIFVNINDSQTTLSNGGVQHINNSANGEHFAWMVESGIYGVYNFNDRLSGRIGYEGWFVDGVAIAVHQHLNPVDASMGQSTNTAGEIFYHGASAGFDLLW